MATRELAYDVFADAMARAHPNAHIAALFEVAGAQQTANGFRDAAWAAGDCGARVASAVAAIIAGADATVEAQACTAAIAARMKGGENTALAADALGLLWAATVGIGRDIDAAEHVLLWREVLAPGRSFPALRQRQVSNESTVEVGAALALADAARREPDPVDQGALLLRWQLLAGTGSDIGATDSIISYAREGAGGALLALLLHHVDSPYEHEVEDNTVGDFLKFLASHPTDVAEREAFESRRQFHITGHWPATPSAQRESQYVQALADAPREAARIAQSRADETTDTALAVAWSVRSISLLQRAGVPGAELFEAAGALLELVQQHDKPLPAVQRLAVDLAVGSALRARRIDQAAAVATKHGLTDDHRRLATLISATSSTVIDAALVRRVCGNYELVRSVAGCVTAGASDMAEAAAALDESAQIADPQARREVQELRLFIDLLRNHRVDRALADATAWTFGGEPSIPCLWAMWLSAHALDRLLELVPRLKMLARSTDGEMRTHVHAAIAEAYVAMKRPDGAKPHLADIPDSLWRSAISKRGEPRTPQMTQTGSWVAIRDLVDPTDATTAQALNAAQEHLKQERWTDAAESVATVADTAAGGSRREDILLFAAAAAVDSVDDTTFAQALLQSVVDRNPNNARAWSTLITMHARRGQIAQLAQLCQDPRMRISDGALFDTLQGTIKLEGCAPGDQLDILRFVLLSRRDLAKHPEAEQLVNHAYQAAVASDRLHEFHQLLERLEFTFEDTPTIDAIRTLMGRTQDQLGLGVDIDSVVRRAASNNFDDDSFARIDAFYERSGDRHKHARTLQKLAANAEYAKFAPDLELEAIRVVRDLEGQPDRAFRLLQRNAIRHPKHVPTQLELALHYKQTEDWEKAVTHLESAAKRIRNPELRARTYRELGELYENKLSRRGLALESYLVSFICSSDDAVTFRRLEDLYTQMGRFKDLVGAYDIAISHAKEATKGDLDLEELLVEKARIEFQQLNQPSRALDTLLEAIRLNPREAHYIDLATKALSEASPRDKVELAVQLHLDALSTDERAKALQDPAIQRFA